LRSWPEPRTDTRVPPAQRVRELLEEIEPVEQAGPDPCSVGGMPGSGAGGDPRDGGVDEAVIYRPKSQR
jgi:hypothetical protein